jgi:hypothetical protein
MGTFTMLTDEEYALINRFIARRNELYASERSRIAAQIAELVRPRLSRDLQTLDPEELLERLATVS